MDENEYKYLKACFRINQDETRIHFVPNDRPAREVIGFENDDRMYINLSTSSFVLGKKAKLSDFALLTRLEL